MSESVTPPASPERARKNRLLLLILALSFVVPFIVGDLAYRFHWYEGAQVNKGRLIDPPVEFATLATRNATGEALTAAFAGKHWWLLYVVPADCEAACRNRLFQMRQVRKALGKESDRLRQAIVVTGALSPATEALLQKEFPDFVRISGETARIDAAFAAVTPAASAAGELYIMDPMGWIMLSYAPEANEKVSVEKAEDVLTDLRKLLKASRIG